MASAKPASAAGPRFFAVAIQAANIRKHKPSQIVVEESPGEIRVISEERAGQRRHADSAEQRALNRRRPRYPHGDGGAEEKLGRRFDRQQLRQQGHDQLGRKVGNECPMDGIEAAKACAFAPPASMVKPAMWAG